MGTVSIFPSCPPNVSPFKYNKQSAFPDSNTFFAVFPMCFPVFTSIAYLREVANVPSKKKMENSGNSRGENSGAGQENQAEELDPGHDEKAKNLLAMLSGLKKGQKLKLLKFDIKEGSGMILRESEP